MKKILAVLVLVSVFTLFVGTSLYANKEKMVAAGASSCKVCHEIPPALNACGEKFKEKYKTDKKLDPELCK